MRPCTGLIGCWPGGEDPKFVARRITRMAVEDIGLADPQAQQICVGAWGGV